MKVNGETSTFSEAYLTLQKSKIREMPDDWASFDTHKYVTDAGDITIEAEWPILKEIEMLTGLVKEGIDPNRVTWFYYSHDWSRDCDELHIFFVACGDRIVLEECSFGNEYPLMLKRNKEREPTWNSEPYINEAVLRHWYSRFYAETLAGKLMVLRPDEPLLYYYQRPSTRDVLKEVSFVTLMKAYLMLWVAVALLVAIAFPAIKDVMGIVALVLFIGVLWRAWASRKVGDDAL